MARLYLDPDDAKTEGERRLRTLLHQHTSGSLARRLLVSDRSVRRWARGECSPDTRDRLRFREVYDWPMAIWDAPPSSDVYTGEEPATPRRE